mmetsp:Transcript_11838/g.25645  ORF Transcript_11838/g.25645 Transcript_11838/m.25645 type:complete len:106 (+) Transcript_11838:371-688(+)|eukprot:CAMPEP_0178529214 /NCGR_PEP_ID=MMETSP0696-20121128/32212_1 /TAXON_ID=265572 /ORGANISM="Extubocellulus spinifer, Strain CCMP396" /LENGTH=105 /DNA_ID=CAMNT_0020160911 /DNA_START=283 /DNA_END=600 /DNA_ORIENTATION=+
MARRKTYRCFILPGLGEAVTGLNNSLMNLQETLEEAIKKEEERSERLWAAVERRKKRLEKKRREDDITTTAAATAATIAATALDPDPGDRSASDAAVASSADTAG